MALAARVFARLAALGHAPSAPLLGHSIKAAARVGATELQDRLLDAALARSDIAEGLSAQLKGLKADRLTILGDLDAALATLEDAQQAFEALGDRRSIAVTKCKIADILATRGDLDAALALHLERLPIAEEMGDIDSRAHIRFACAQLRLQRGDHERGAIQTIYEELDGAFRDALQVQRPDAIGPIVALLSQVLAMGGQRDAAREVLGIAAAAFEQLGQPEGVAHVQHLLDRIGD